MSKKLGRSGDGVSEKGKGVASPRNELSAEHGVAGMTARMEA